MTVAEYHGDCPKMPVVCSVDNCQYNKDQLCHAKEILVSRSGDKKAHTPEGTFCATFENRMT